MSDVGILGTGAVGVFVASWLESAPRFFARQAAGECEWQLVDAARGGVRTLRATVAASTENAAELRHLLVCVRGDQVDAAMDTAAKLAPSAALGLAAPVSPTQLAALRARHAGRAIYLLVPMFNAWPDGERRYLWLQPPIVKTLFSGEDDAAAVAAARDMADRLRKGGMRTRVVPSAILATATFFAGGLPVLAGWEISGWTARIVVGAKLRRTTARAMREALTVAREARGLSATMIRIMPTVFVALFLAIARLFVNKNLAAMWAHHGPKVAGQTRAMLDTMLTRADSAGVATPSLRELRSSLSDQPERN
jgi:hypothetical protein